MRSSDVELSCPQLYVISPACTNPLLFRAYRHWGCVTPKVISNMKEIFENAEDLDGFDDLNDEDQEKLRKAWEDGKVDPADVPESAKKPEGEEDDEEEEEEGEKKKKAPKKAAKKDKEEDAKGNFKLEYAGNGRSKCKGWCLRCLPPFFLFGVLTPCLQSARSKLVKTSSGWAMRSNSVVTSPRTSNPLMSSLPCPRYLHLIMPYRGWQHWGCTPAAHLAKLKRTYTEVESIPGFDEIKAAEQEKVRAAWEVDEIPEDDKGPGEPVDTGKKKASAPRKSKKAKDADGEDEERPKKRVRKTKVSFCCCFSCMGTDASCTCRRPRLTMTTRRKRNQNQNALRLKRLLRSQLPRRQARRRLRLRSPVRTLVRSLPMSVVMRMKSTRSQNLHPKSVRYVISRYSLLVFLFVD